MKKTLLVASLMLLSGGAFAIPVTYTVEGELALTTATDDFGLDGANFSFAVDVETEDACILMFPGTNANFCNYPTLAATWTFTDRPGGNADLIIALSPGAQIQTRNRTGAASDGLSFGLNFTGGLGGSALAGLIQPQFSINLPSTFFPSTGFGSFAPLPEAIAATDILDIGGGTGGCFRTFPVATSYDCINLGGFSSLTGGDPGSDPDPVPVPEPGTLTLLGLGLAGMGIARRRMKA